MKTLLSGYTFFLLSFSCFAQTTHHLSLGASYGNGQYYNLQTDAVTNVPHSQWDIAFSVYGATDGAIFINEGASYSGTAPKLYHIPNKNFSDNIVASDLGGVLKNDEISWANGAFNSIKVVSNFADYGWGAYNMSNHKIEGTALYAIELGNGDFKKLKIDTLVGGTYYFSYANFDGTNLQQQSITKSAYPNQTLAYFSFVSNSVVTVEPNTGWDWLFTRYETVIDNGGTATPYVVGGILTNKGVEAVLADGINPATVDIANYSTRADSLTIIGHTWKEYDFVNGWITDTDRVYFIKTADSSLYKAQFIDFQGSSTGQGTFLKTFLGKWTALPKIEQASALQSFQVFPNPVQRELQVAFSLEKNQANLQLQIVDLLGRVQLQKEVEGQAGLNALLLNLANFSTGNYMVILQSEALFITKKISVL